MSKHGPWALHFWKLMSVMTSKITGNSTIYSAVVKSNKASFGHVRGIHRWHNTLMLYKHNLVVLLSCGDYSKFKIQIMSCTQYMAINIR